MLAALEKKIIDGFVFPADVAELAVQRGLGKVVINPFVDAIPELNGVPYIVLMTSKQTLDSKPELLRAAIRAIGKAMRFARTNPIETEQIIRKYFPDMDDSVFKKIVEEHRRSVPRSPLITEQQVNATLRWINIADTNPLGATRFAASGSSCAM